MKAVLDLSSMQNCACFNVRRAARLITQCFDAEARRHGLRPTQTTLLGVLRAKDGWLMADLSDWLGMERTTLLRNLRPLQRDGLVRASGSGRGGRATLSITPKGRAALDEMLPAWRAAQDKVVSTLGRERWSAIISDLALVASKLQTHENTP